MSIISITAGQEEVARTFCIDVACEFGIRAKHFKPSNSQERRWLQEGIRPVEQFETVGNMLAESLCK